MIVPIGLNEQAAEIIRLFPDNNSNTPNNEFSTKPTISQVLWILGIRSKLKGFRYLRSAVELALKEPESVDAITKWTYPSIAKKYHSTPARVERSIRHAILSTESTTNEFRFNVFPWINNGDHHLTNKEFISGVAEYLRCYDE